MKGGHTSQIGRHTSIYSFIHSLNILLFIYSLHSSIHCIYYHSSIHYIYIATKHEIGAHMIKNAICQHTLPSYHSSIRSKVGF
jgi:hypothetical protein